MTPPLAPRPADLVPELSVRDLAKSLAFWCGACGFAVIYDRPEHGFACIQRGSARVMLDQLGTDRDWVTGPLEPPLGRGINLEIAVEDIAPILVALAAVGWPLFDGAAIPGAGPGRLPVALLREDWRWRLNSGPAIFALGSASEVILRVRTLV